MKPLVLVLFLLSITVQSWSNQIDVKNLTLNYKEDNGQGSFDKFIFDKYSYDNQQDFNMFYSNQDMIFDINGEEIVIRDEKGAFKDFSRFNVSNFSIATTTSKIEGSLPYLSGSSTESDLEITNARIQCRTTVRPPLEQDLFFFLEDCLTNSNSAIKRVRINNKNKSELISLLEDTLEIEAEKVTSIDNISMEIKNGNFNLTMSLDTGLKVTVKMSGTIKYFDNQKMIRLSISKAKAGIFNIREKIFEEIEKRESDKLQVERPNIFIYLE